MSKDPIGLQGGPNAWQYAPKPTSWIDPLGLTGSLFLGPRRSIGLGVIRLITSA
ncbi:hypothetical protein CFB34_008850 [Burkholderia sp. HI4860]|nr:hypothetical protein [Burkholderia sp. HI4860]